MNIVYFIQLFPSFMLLLSHPLFPSRLKNIFLFFLFQLLFKSQSWPVKKNSLTFFFPFAIILSTHTIIQNGRKLFSSEAQKKRQQKKITDVKCCHDIKAFRKTASSSGKTRQVNLYLLHWKRQDNVTFKITMKIVF